MPVKVYNLSKVLDAQGNILFDQIQDMTLPWVIFPITSEDIKRPEEIRPYWESVEAETRRELLAFLAKPSDPIDPRTITTGLGITMPIPNKVFSYPEVSIIDEILPEIGEALRYALAQQFKLTPEEKKKLRLHAGVFENEEIQDASV